ncbi:hypothetical protein V5P93_003345 [Actinokineospora auranticolor]|uniref:hypothetical protein n=1 Tax=Actinokineospora auranticolor TaxID=155976 RepID=UPI0011B0732A|nr:hypothetical protein [Actinokineospora auranticolor]
MTVLEVVAPETAPMSPHLPGLGDDGRVPLSVERVEGRTGRALAEAARGADLPAIGAHHSPAHIASGVAADCLRDAGCLVVIVPVG